VVEGAAIFTHFLAGTAGFGLGGYVAYRLVMKKLESSVESMFGFGDGSSLIDAIAEVEEE